MDLKKERAAGLFFPHEIIRKGQDEFIDDIYKSLEEKKILLAHAPTGLGKTASVLSVTLPWALENKKRIFFLTNRHTQHQIAVNTLKLIKEKHQVNFSCADLIGKRWMCSHDVAGLFGNEFNEFCKTVAERGECEFYNRVRNKKELSVEAKRLIERLKEKSPQHNEEIMRESKDENMCSYEIALALAKDAEIIIGDYNYIFNPHVQSTLLAKLKLELQDIILIVDEGHNLPGRIMDMLSSALTGNMIKNAQLEAKKHNYNGLVAWLQELMQILSRLANFAEKDFGREKLLEKDTFISEINKSVNYDELLAELELAGEEVRKKQKKSYLGGIAAFLESWKGEDQGFARIISEKAGRYGPVIVLSYLCLDPRIISKEVFSRVYSGVIMSGTLKPTCMYRDILGLENSLEKEYLSPFPWENKLSLIVPETSTKYNLRGQAMYQKIAQKCSELALLIPGNVALFFPSYQLRDSVSEHLNLKKKLFWEKQEMSAEGKELFLEEFKREKERGGALLGVAGANFAEGVDLPGNLLNGVIVVGLPLAHPDLRTKEIIKFYDQKFGKGWDYGYVFPAITKCIQSAGRCIRSETDRGVVVFLDERFAWKNYYDCLPREGLIVSRDFEKLLKDFFAGFKSCV